MKQCPVCKANYADDSLSFCLNDGATLLTTPDEQVTQVRSSGSGNQVPYSADPTLPAGKVNPDPFHQPPTPTQPKSNNTALIALSLAVLLLLIVGGVVAAFFLIPRGPAETKSSFDTPTPSPSTRDESDDLKQKIANLERQIQEQKNSPTPYSTSTPVVKQTPLDQNSKVVARVAQSNDGFLSLRTEPSVRSGVQLVKMPSGSVVEIEDCQKNYLTVDGRRGRWCMVTFSGQTGWAFDAWLIY